MNDEEVMNGCDKIRITFPFKALSVSGLEMFHGKLYVNGARVSIAKCHSGPELLSTSPSCAQLILSCAWYLLFPSITIADYGFPSLIAERSASGKNEMHHVHDRCGLLTLSSVCPSF